MQNERYVVSSSDRRVAVGVFFLVLAAYIVTYNGAFKSNDERALFSGADSFVKRGAFTTNQIYWDYTHVGVFTTGGDMVPNYEPAQMVLAIPFYLWGRLLGAGVQGVMFFGAVVMAGAAAMIYLLLLELGGGRRGSLLGSLVFAFATAAWPYSRSFFREPLTILAYTLAFYGVLRYRDCGLPIGEHLHPPAGAVSANQQISKSHTPGLVWLALSGFGLGLALTTKQIGVAIIPSLALLAVGYEWRRTSGSVKQAKHPERRPGQLPAEAEGGVSAAESGRPSTPSSKLRWTPLRMPSIQGIRCLLMPGRTVWRRRVSAALAFAVPLAIMLLLGRWYTATTLEGVETFARDVVDYTTNPQLSSSDPARLLRASIGLTISPYKGLLWFSPVLLLGLIGAVPFVRRHPWEGLALLGAAAAHLAGYSRYLYWSGGVTWGSRYMLQVVPFLVLLAAPVWTWMARDDGRRTKDEGTTADRRPPTSDRRPQAAARDDASRSTLDVSRFTFHVSRFAFDVSRITQYALRTTIWLLIALSVIIQLLGISIDYRTFEVKWLLDKAELWGGIGQAIEGLFMRPAESPVVGHLALLLSGTQPLDFAWMQLRPEGKWAFVPAGLLLSLLLFGAALAAFVWIWRRPERAWPVAGLLTAGTLVVCSSLLMIYRQGDARFDPYNVDRFLKPLIAVLDKVECERSGLAPTTCRDALLVPDPTLTDYFLNYLAGPLVWYSVEPQPVDDRLLAQMLTRYGRIWLARDRNAQTDDAEGRRAWERYLTDHAYKLDEQKFGDWARLMSFSAAGRPAETAMPRQALGEMVLQEARLGIEQRRVLARSETGQRNLAIEPLDDGKVQARPGDRLQVGLTWQANTPPAGNYTVFLQLLDAGSQVKAQRDRWPGDGLHPTAGLAAGQVISDNLAISLDVPPGSYRLITGLYRGDQPAAPRLTGPGGDHVTLALVEVR
jgi:hypothetical protein